ncbi:hypothetical protein KUTeg_019603 [Tegillarca granosa]|uniref:Uncharacterized protein n=1 Tax=Tegillarca granosa TaxID=220873 RepID=A0ABQ9EI36_TEGGR|nr:hypothetical protein KUTeg_019603 [Tegillarca granosa]
MSSDKSQEDSKLEQTNEVCKEMKCKMDTKTEGDQFVHKTKGDGVSSIDGTEGAHTTERKEDLSATERTKGVHTTEGTKGVHTTVGTEGATTTGETEGAHTTGGTVGAHTTGATEGVDTTGGTECVQTSRRTATEGLQGVSSEGAEDVFKTEEVKEIDKRSLGKIIVKYCGNEGNVENESKTSLRKLLQASSDYLQKESDKVWKNAEIHIYDNDDLALTIKSGKGENSFVVQYKGKTDEVEIVNVERQKQCCVS